MTTARKARAMCDVCGFVYSMKVMRLNSYNMLVCPQDYEGRYDLKNHPQNKTPNVRDDAIVKNARPDNGGRNLTWESASITWNDIPEPDTRKWGTV